MDTNYLIVVGVDGSEGGRRALRWATREAAARGGTVQAVVAWRWDGVEAPVPAETTPAAERRRAEERLRHELAQLPAEHAGVAIATQVVEGRPADALTAAARGANLLVLGSHGHSRIWHTVLGSVSEECIRQATCPVVVVPVPNPAPARTAEPALRA